MVKITFESRSFSHNDVFILPSVAAPSVVSLNEGKGTMLSTVTQVLSKLNAVIWSDAQLQFGHFTCCNLNASMQMCVL